MNKSDEYWEGYEEYDYNYSMSYIKSNPYKLRTKKYKEWRKGFLDARIRDVGVISKNDPKNIN